MLIGSQEAIIHNNLVFLLADVMESLMMDTSSMMRRNGLEFKHESKRAYNAAIANLRKMKNSVTNNCSLEAQSNYGNDADNVCELLKLIVDRCGRDDRILADIFEYTKAKLSQLKMTNINLDIMASIEQEEIRKAEKQVYLACKVFEVDDFYKKFDKNAYYARVLVIKALKVDGFQEKYIAERLKLSLKTVERALDSYSELFENDEFLKNKEKEFMKEFLKTDLYINKEKDKE